MSTVNEIAEAIEKLSFDDRRALYLRLRTGISEFDGDEKWAKILRDPTPRPSLSALGDEIERLLHQSPESLPTISDSDFDRNS